MAATAERATLLYIEDNRDNWEVTELQLRRRFDLVWARNDEEACKALSDESRQFAAVLMDIELQGSRLSGIDLTKLVRGALDTSKLPPYAKQVPVRRDLPIIFVTGYSARYTENELIAQGGNRMLTKPVNFGELSMALSALAFGASSNTIAGPQKSSQVSGVARLLTDNPRFHAHLKSLAEAGLFAPRGYASDVGALLGTLGKQGVDAAAVAATVLDLVHRRSDMSGYLTALVYRRAIACHLIATRTAVVDVERATATGFLLDAGLLIRAIHDPAGALEIGMAPAASRLQREHVGNEIEHPERILEVAQAWNLDEDMIVAVQSHHEREVPGDALARVAWAAERLAAVFETGDIVANNAAAMATGKALGLMSKDVEALLEELPDRVRLLGETTDTELPAQTPYKTWIGSATPPLAVLARAYRELESTSEALLAEKRGLADRLASANDILAASHKKDLALIAAVQTMLLPRDTLVRRDRVQLAAFYRAADDCGGDWWWHDQDEERVRVFIGDVSGHGAGSAMVTGSIASATRLARTLSPHIGAVDLLQLLHNELWGMAHGDYHMTMAILEIPKQGSTAHIYSAAAPHILAMNAEGKVSAAVTRGTPLGLPTETFTVGRAEVSVHPGSRLMCFTDGLYEFHTASGQELGVRSMRKFLSDSRNLPLDEALRGIMRSVDAVHPRDVPQGDDMTLVLIDIA
ncbi:MAG: SpoIIE family protein phosphatase [Myxococcota bacterium]